MREAAETSRMADPIETKLVRVPLDPFNLDGQLVAPPHPHAGAVIVDGSGASTRRPELRAWASTMAEAGFATLVADLLTGEEQPRRALRRDRPDVAFMAGRLVVVIDFLAETLGGDAARPIYLLTTGSATAAGLFAETERSSRVHGILAWAGRPAMAGVVLPIVQRPVLFLTPRDAPNVADECARAASVLGPSASVRPIERRNADAQIPGLALAWIAQTTATRGGVHADVDGGLAAPDAGRV